MSIIDILGITPWPWQWVPESWGSIHGKGGDLLTTVKSGPCCSNNCRLIAAAPKMLEALIALIATGIYQAECAYLDNGWLEDDAKKNAFSEYEDDISVIESATGKNWQEIKGLI